MNTQKNANYPVCAIVGVGPGNGAAIAEAFSNAGYTTALLARNLDRLKSISAGIPNSHAYPCDAADADSIDTTFDAIVRDLGKVDVLIYNAGKGVWGDALSVSSEDFENAWRLNVFGLFHASRKIVPSMRDRGAGNIVLIGATASRRGSAGTTAFAAAKAAQRSFGQSLAKAYGPDGIHVSLIVIDAVVGEPLMKKKLQDRPDDFFCQPHDIAATVLLLTQQAKSAWTFELDLRPFKESWS